jgi:hypothetical protein
LLGAGSPGAVGGSNSPGIRSVAPEDGRQQTAQQQHQQQQQQQQQEESASSSLQRFSARIRVLAATDLCGAADATMAETNLDSYCVCFVEGMPEKKFQTASVADSNDPLWNHEGRFDSISVHDKIIFEVWSKAGELLGRAALKTEGLYPGGFDEMLVLQESASGRNNSELAKLRVVVSMDSAR